jgi:hypothetical protein
VIYLEVPTQEVSIMRDGRRSSPGLWCALVAFVAVLFLPAALVLASSDDYLSEEDLAERTQVCQEFFGTAQDL